jgi:ketosteroid isomerase-like protein
MSEDDQTRIAAWVDKLEIRELLERYMRYNDDLDADRIAELFDDDARFQVMGRVICGRDAIRNFFARDGANSPPWTVPGELFKQPPSIHISANPVIDVDGDTANAETDFLVVGRDDAGRARPMLVGRYSRATRRRADGHRVAAGS